MTTVNPYAAPTADDIGGGSTATYEPKVLSLTGRIGRLRYLAFSLVWGVLVTVAAMVLFYTSILLAGIVGMAIAMVLVYVGALVPMFALVVRRLNDLNQRGWWSLLLLVPFANIGLAIYMLCWPGTAGMNRFGPAPVANTPLVVAGAISLPVMTLVSVLVMFSLAPPSEDMYMQPLEFDSGFEYYGE